MTPEERLDELERRLDQSETANEIMFGLLFTIVSDQRWRDVVKTPEDMAGYLRIAAGSREDQEDHIAAQILNRIAAKMADG